MSVPLSYWGGGSSTPRIYNIEVTLDQIADLTVVKAPLMYNKKHVFTIEIDDALNDLYRTVFKLFGGGMPEKEPAYTSPGFYITDGCGNIVPFKAASSAFVKRYLPTPILDWFQQAQDWGGDNLTYTEMDALVAAGYGIVDHGFYSDMQNVPSSPQAVIDYIDWCETRYGFRPLNIIAPGGVTFDYAAWKSAWFNNGCRFSTYASGTGSDTVRIDDINVMTMTEPIEMGRYSLENNDGSVLKAKIDTLMGLTGNQWLRSFGHNIEDSSFIRYAALKELTQYIETTYGRYGADNLWVASATDLVSYLYCRDGAVVNKLIDGGKHLITLDTTLIPSFVTKRMLTLILTSTANIVNIKVNGYKGSSGVDLVNITM